MIDPTRTMVLMLALGSACTLEPATLDGGDEIADGDPDTGDTGDTGEPLPECLAGSNLDGSTAAPPAFQFVGDVIDCAGGWGHDVPLLASEWTIPAMEGHPVMLLPDGEGIQIMLQSTASPPEQSVWFTILDGEGKIVDTRFAPAGMSAFITHAAVDDEGRVIFVRRNPAQPDDSTLGMLEASGETLAWSMPIAMDWPGPIAPVPGGFLLAGSDDLTSTHVFRVSDQGDLLDDMTTDVANGDWLIGAGDGFVLAGGSTISRFEADGDLDWQWTDDTVDLRDIAADSLGILAIGNRSDGPWVARIADGQLDWSSSYHRSDSWHPAGMPEQPRDLYDYLFVLAPLGDGTFVAAGSETVSDFEISQPWLVHFTGDGLTLARDRVFVEDGIVTHARVSGSALYVLPRTDGGQLIRKYPI